MSKKSIFKDNTNKTVNENYYAFASKARNYFLKINLSFWFLLFALLIFGMLYSIKLVFSGRVFDVFVMLFLWFSIGGLAYFVGKFCLLRTYEHYKIFSNTLFVLENKELCVGGAVNGSIYLSKAFDQSFITLYLCNSSFFSSKKNGLGTHRDQKEPDDPGVRFVLPKSCMVEVDGSSMKLDFWFVLDDQFNSVIQDSSWYIDVVVSESGKYIYEKIMIGMEDDSTD